MISNEKGPGDPRGKGRKLAWQETSHENTMMLRMGMLPNVLPVATYRWCPQGGLSHGQTACEPVSRGVITMKSHAIGRS